jgi:gamma-glutamyl:cysteine ligase YbdK (ATP-grasp superfamily)
VTDLDSERPVAIDADSTVAAEDIRSLVAEIQKLANREGSAGGDRSVAAIAGLAEGIQGLVKNMRNEQQMLRDWIEAQQEDARAMRKTLDRLNDKIGGAK